METARDRGWGMPPCQNLTLIPCPGIPLRVRPEVAPLFAELIRRVNAVKGPGFMTSSGGYNHRAVRGYERQLAATEDPRYLSNHSWGLAADFRAGTNPMSSERLTTDMPANMDELCASVGLSWGGHWKRHDPMHVEALLTPAEAQQWCKKLDDSRKVDQAMADFSDSEKAELLRAARCINRAWDTPQKSKVDNKEFWLSEFILFTDANVSALRKGLGK